MKIALLLVLAQLVTTLVVAASGLLHSVLVAWSLLLGGLICVLPNGWYALRLLAQSRRNSGSPEVDAGRFVSVAYRGEAIKLVMTAALFALVFSRLRPLSVPAVFAGYLVCVLVNWVSLVFIGRQAGQKQGNEQD